MISNFNPNARMYRDVLDSQPWDL